MMKVGLIGCGAIGTLLVELLDEHVPGVRVLAVHERQGYIEGGGTAPGPDIRLVERLDDFLDSGMDLVVECAGHRALRELGPAVLAAGRDLLVASVGAIAERALESSLIDAAQAGRARLRIPSGALGGLDVLGAAKLAGLREVRYEGRKAPGAWRGTPAETRLALDEVAAPVAFFEGTAREAARMFPQNANVAAAVALAGLGFDRTKVVLYADPSVAGNTHRIAADGDFGHIDTIVMGKTLPANPKTSMLAPYSLVRAIANLDQTLIVA
ncbi:aspartate dehydrogenase [Burkholderia cepacia]|uniref:aspartate dehydrogenase n=1 Tax=Burkholderia cepacia TaxID=292 RepID=UPI0007C816C2|nr:aspartate dehydrogenase [Burkholderia cepacia]